MNCVMGNCELLSVVMENIITSPVSFTVRIIFEQFSTRSDTNRPVHSQEQARSLKFQIYLEE